METGTICAIVLAAGRSRRMGRQKLLLPIADQPMICRVVDQVIASAVEHVLVVVGADGHEISEALGNRAVQLVPNPEPDSQMIDSVRRGLAASPTRCAAVLIVLGDQPAIGPELIDRLIQQRREHGRGIAVPTFDGKRGHPLLLAARYREEVLQQYDDVGLRGLLDAHPEDIVEVEAAMAGVLEDIDVPEDYQRMTSAGWDLW